MLIITRIFRHIQQYLSGLLDNLAEEKGLTSVAFLTKDLHVYPDFHGNRSPIADPTLKGMVSNFSFQILSERIALQHNNKLIYRYAD